MGTFEAVTPPARVKEMADYMEERHRIYLKRKAGIPGPWTSDPVLANGRFCNVFRELDTVTIWIEENIRKPYADHPHLWFMLCIARYINWPDTLATLIEAPGAWPSHDDFTPENMTEVLTAKASWGEKVYTGAYMIRAESDKNAPWYNWSKHKYLAEIVLGRLWEDRETWAELLDTEPCPGVASKTLPTLEMVWDQFQQKRYVGWGPFMAYEVVTDLRHTRYLRNAPDIYTWANAGPGAIRGLNRLYGRDLNAKPKPAQTNAEMLAIVKWLNGYDALGFVEVFGPVGKSPRFEMRDVEHCLCEADKLFRVRLGEGKMRSKYDYRKATKI